MLVSGARRLRSSVGRRRLPEWEYVPEGWARSRDDIRGWNQRSVLDAYRSKLPAFRAALDGTGPLAFSSSAAVEMGAANVADQNTILVFAVALLLASRNQERVSILDWGGGLGFHSFVTRAVLPDDVEIEYHCKDMPLICAYGRRALPEITFWDDDECLTRGYDLVVASSALQYGEAWRADLEGLAGASTSYLLLTRLPVVVHHPSFVVLQRAHHYRFDTEYLSWVFNRRELVEVATGVGMTLVREFLLGHQPQVAGAPEQDTTWAYLFRRTGEPGDGT